MTAPRPEAVTWATCGYCLGIGQARQDALVCSDACRQARHRALSADPEDILTPPLRAETFSRERAAATGWGALSPVEQYAADIRVRRAAGLEVYPIERYLAEDDGGAFKRAYHEATRARRAAADALDLHLRTWAPEDVGRLRADLADLIAGRRQLDDVVDGRVVGP